MFCSNCGSPAAEGARFCGNCGSPIRQVEAAPPQPSRPPQAPIPSVVSAGPTQTCPWCSAVANAGQSSCPRCGATLQARLGVTESGWSKLPGRKDMAKLQFGNSFCQIEGLYVPVADLNLASGDSVYFTHHVLLWKDPHINVTTMSMKGGWTRMLAGLPLIMTQAQGPGHIAFSRDAPGEMIALPLQRGEAVDVREHLFMTATSNVAYDWFSTNIWFTTGSGDDKETHYPLGMFMDRFIAPQSAGLLLLHAAGNVFVRQLAPGQAILVKPSALIFKDPTVEMQLHFEIPQTSFLSWGSWSNRYLWLRLWGPGRVAVQSVFDAIEGERKIIQNWSAATETRW